MDYSDFFQNLKILTFPYERSEIYLKKGQKFVEVRLGTCQRAEILLEHALLVPT
jgi:hypothetical protein